MPVSAARAAEIAERRRQAVQLRLAGIEWATIADRLGYTSKGAACKDVTRALEDTTRGLQVDADALRAVEGARLDRMQAGVWGRATAGDHAAIASVLRIMGRRAKLFGLDAPVKVDTTVSTELDREIDALVARLGSGDTANA